MPVVVIYNEVINETLNVVNKYTHTYTFIHIRRLIKFCVKPKIGVPTIS